MWFISGEVQGNQTTWGSWTPLNKYPIDPCNAETLAAPPCMVSWGPGRLDIFVLGQGGDMWIRKLRIKDFRGMKNAVVDFSESQTIFNADS